MTEQLLNSIIGKSMPWHHKIGDAGKYTKPFDGIGVVQGRSVYWEAKLLKKPLAFNFSRLEDHQIANLLSVQRLNKDALALFLVCVQFARGDNRVFIFRDMEYINKRKTEKLSILKKEFESRKNYVKIHKQLINIDELLSLDPKLEYVDGI